jgi:large repetitive protein
MRNHCERIQVAVMSLLWLSACCFPAWGDVMSSGDVNPTDPMTWNNKTTSYIGNTSDGSLTISGGSGLTSYSTYFGVNSGAIGTATVIGSGSKWNNTLLYIGHNGNGTLAVEQGGVVETSGWAELGRSTGSVTVKGTGSTWKVQSLKDDGMMDITDGGFVWTYGWTQVGYTAGAQGRIKVDGAGSKLQVSSYPLEIGSFASGTLDITNGAVVSNSLAYLGRYVGATGTVTVDGANSQWNNSSQLFIGNDGYSGGGNGVLNVSNGASVTVQGATLVGSPAAPTGAINFGAGGGTLKTASLVASPDALNGTGTINTRGLVSDIDLVFDASHPLVQNLRINDATVNLDMSVASANSLLGAGCGGNGSLTIRSLTVVSTSGFVGYRAGSAGVATVDGSGSAWNCNYQLFVGFSGNGKLDITRSGNALVASHCNIGYNASSTGEINVTGAGSLLSMNGNLYVGYSGSGSLNVSDGAVVTTPNDTFVAYNAGSSGSIHFGSGGGTIETRTLFASPSQITGAGTINVHGLVSDISLVFDATHPVIQSLSYSGTTVNLDLSQNAPSVGYLGAGYLGYGSLTIRNGVSVASGDGFVGYQQGSSGLVAVNGTGSVWSAGALKVGYNGNGRLNITEGGSVTNSTGEIGCNGQSRGIVQVDGQNSQWNNSDMLNLGSMAPLFAGSATLNITGGGTVKANGIQLGSKNTLLGIDVGNGSRLVLSNGTGQIYTRGTVRIFAGASPSANAVYTPIVASTFTAQGGVYQAVGGTWNTTKHEFTVSGVQTGNSGLPLTIDRLSVERMLIDVPASTWELGVSVAATGVSSPLTLTATAVSGEPLDALQALLSPGNSILGGWNLTADSGYAAGDPLYLSFGNQAAGAFSAQAVRVWSYDGTKWLPFDATDATSDGKFASFTANGLGSYAVTVPEPGTIALLSLAVIGIIVGKTTRRRN